MNEKSRFKSKVLFSIKNIYDLIMYLNYIKRKKLKFFSVENNKVNILYQNRSWF